MELDKWEFEGPVEYIKTLARARDIPKPDSIKPESAAPNEIPSRNTSSCSTDATSEASVGDRDRSWGMRPASGRPPLPAGPPPTPAPTSATQMKPPPPPGRPPLSTRPPLPPGPPPLASVDFRKAAALPESLKRAPPPPVSVSAFKNLPPAQVRPQLVAMPFPTSSPTTVAASAERPKTLKRPRGMSLSSNPRRTFDSYDVLEQVGTGTYGEVFRARERESGEIVALKKVKLEDEQEGFPVTALREIKFLQVSDHPNIVKLKEVVSSRASDATRNKGSVYMVFEYCECDLVGLMRTSKLDESHIMCLLKQLLEAVHFTHVNRHLHRDIKPSNILVNSKGMLKLADWGLCRRFSEGGKYTNRVVTRWYRAPELLLGEHQYSAPIDMWGVGCVMAELLLGRVLFPGVDDVNQLKLIFETCGKPSKEHMPTGWEHLQNAKELLNEEATPSQMHLRFAPLRPVARDLLLKLLELDPAKRINAKDALNHDYFWGSPGPCMPHVIPVPKGTGVHELQVREEYAKKHTETAHARVAAASGVVPSRN